MVPVGGTITAGTVGNFEINYSNKRWNIIYDGNLVGYFPESLWKGHFTKVGEVQVFGEVSASMTMPPESQMGNGILGSNTGSAVISNFSLIRSKNPNQLSPYEISDTRAYDYGNVTATGLNYGGSGGYQ